MPRAKGTTKEKTVYTRKPKPDSKDKKGNSGKK
jgi:hypothetical protein